jgi:hypothetical protein
MQLDIGPKPDRSGEETPRRDNYFSASCFPAGIDCLLDDPGVSRLPVTDCPEVRN